MPANHPRTGPRHPFVANGAGNCIKCGEKADGVTHGSEPAAISVGPPAGLGAYSSNLNVGFYSSDLKPLINPTIVVYIDQQIVNSYIDYQGWWDAQLNCWSPPGLTSGFTQYLPMSDGGGQLYTEFDYFKPNDGLIQYDEIEVIDISMYPGYNLPAGFKLAWTINTDPTTRNVLGMTLTLYDQNTNVVASNFGPVTNLVGWVPAWATPITGMTLEFGSLGGFYSNYTSAAGRIFYVPAGGQSYSVVNPTTTPGVNSGNPYYPFPAGLVANNAQHTAEQSNMQYSASATSNISYSLPVPQPDGSLIQLFNTTGIFGVKSNNATITVT